MAYLNTLNGIRFSPQIKAPISWALTGGGDSGPSESNLYGTITDPETGYTWSLSRPYGAEGPMSNRVMLTTQDPNDPNYNLVAEYLLNGDSLSQASDATRQKAGRGVDFGFMVPLGAAALGGLLASGALGGSAAGASAGNGAFLGEGVASGIPAWDAAAANAGLATAGAGAAAPAIGNGTFVGEGMASGVPAWDAAATSAGLPLATTPTSLLTGASQSGGLLKTIGDAAGALGGAKTLLPLGAGLLSYLDAKAQSGKTAGGDPWARDYLRNLLGNVPQSPWGKY